jgi:hypothetical protein
MKKLKKIVIDEDMSFSNDFKLFDDSFFIKVNKGTTLFCHITKKKNFVKVEICPPEPYKWLNSKVNKYTYDEFSKLVTLDICLGY